MHLTNRRGFFRYLVGSAVAAVAGKATVQLIAPKTDDKALDQFDSKEETHESSVLPFDPSVVHTSGYMYAYDPSNGDGWNQCGITMSDSSNLNIAPWIFTFHANDTA